MQGCVDQELLALRAFLVITVTLGPAQSIVFDRFFGYEESCTSPWPTVVYFGGLLFQAAALYGCLRLAHANGGRMPGGMTGRIILFAALWLGKLVSSVAVMVKHGGGEFLTAQALVISVALSMHAAVPLAAGRVLPDLTAGVLAVASHILGAHFILDRTEDTLRFGAVLCLTSVLPLTLRVLLELPTWNNNNNTAVEQQAEAAAMNTRPLIVPPRLQALVLTLRRAAQVPPPPRRCSTTTTTTATRGGALARYYRTEIKCWTSRERRRGRRRSRRRRSQIRRQGDGAGQSYLSTRIPWKYLSYGDKKAARGIVNRRRRSLHGPPHDGRYGHRPTRLERVAHEERGRAHPESITAA